MPVRVFEKNLARAVRPLFAYITRKPNPLKMFFPSVQIIRQRREMISLAI